MNWYKIYEKYQKKMETLKKGKAKAIEDKMRSDFENNFVGTKKELEIAEKQLSANINREINKARNNIDEEMIKLEQEMIEEFRKNSPKPFCSNKRAFSVLYEAAYEAASGNSYTDVITTCIEYIEMYTSIQEAIKEGE